MLTCQDSLQAWLLLHIPVWLSLECEVGENPVAAPKRWLWSNLFQTRLGSASTTCPCSVLAARALLCAIVSLSAHTTLVSRAGSPS